MATCSSIKSGPSRLDAKHVLVLSIFLDLLAVSLVVPSLPARYRELGLTGWRFGAMGSVYSAMQILGGVVLGFASDGALGRRGLLLVSFAGAALSYTLAATARSLAMLVLSRVIVGLTKQSVTAVSALMADATTVAERTAWLAHVTCATTLSWAVGTALGGLLSLSPVPPEAVAVALYAANSALVLRALPARAGASGVTGGEQSNAHAQPDATARVTASPAPPRDAKPPHAGAAAPPPPPAPPPLPVRRISSNFAAVLRDGRALRVLSVQLTRVLIVKALGSASDMYELDRWSLTTVENGLLRSYKSVAVLAVQVLVTPLLVRAHTRLHALLHACTAAKVLVDLLEFVPSAALSSIGALPFLPHKLAHHPSLLVYALVCIPARAVFANAIAVSQKSLFTMSVAQAEMGAALAVLDVLQSCAGVLAPLLGGAMLGSVPVKYQPLVAAACNTLLALQLVLVYPPPRWRSRVGPRVTRGAEPETSSAKGAEEAAERPSEAPSAARAVRDTSDGGLRSRAHARPQLQGETPPGQAAAAPAVGSGTGSGKVHAA